ncbi:MAG: hypothetical protein EOP04_14025, partial [Proteobacteria bacterium]
MTHPSVRALVIAALVTGTLLSPVSAHAYEEDTHFILTFVVCRAIGFTEADALVIAKYDQGMDDSPETVANGGIGGIIPHEKEEHLWHSIPEDGKIEAVLQRKNVLWGQVLHEKNPILQLKRLGIFFHYQQDTWAHRHHPNHEATDFKPYRAPMGHALDGHQPDRPPFDPVCALRCLEEGVSYARTFLSTCQHQTPASLFNHYQPASGAVDVNWNDKRKG